MSKNKRKINAIEISKGIPQASMKGNFKKAPSQEISRGQTAGALLGNRKDMPSRDLSVGKAEAPKKGTNSKSLSLGSPNATIKGSLPSRQLNMGKALAIHSKKRSEGKPMMRNGGICNNRGTK